MVLPESRKMSSDNDKNTVMGAVKAAKNAFCSHIIINRVNWCFLLLLLCSFLVIELLVRPHEQFIGPRDYNSIVFPHTDANTVPTWAVPVISVALPIAFVCVVYGTPVLLGEIKPREFHDLIFGVLINIAITANWTSILKVLVGRPRPDFAARCFSNLSTQDLIKALERAGGYPVCKGLSKIVQEGRKSFPSGHTSWTMCSMVFLTLLIAGKLQPFDGKGRIWRMVVSSLPVVGGIIVGITRINDYWHHWTDVMAGTLLGSAIALCVYCAYYPWPFNRSMTSQPLYIAWEEAQLQEPSSSQESTMDSLEPLRTRVDMV